MIVRFRVRVRVVWCAMLGLIWSCVVCVGVGVLSCLGLLVHSLILSCLLVFVFFCLLVCSRKVRNSDDIGDQYEGT
jgi:hypothetical protein